jgi:polysaccharide deacetylase family protein (PEP-CTERM system associated)
MLNIFSVDVEEYFHPTEVQTAISRGAWSTLPLRAEIGARLLLDLLAEHDTIATFFIVGWVAQRHPQLVRSILAAGHEIGCHGFDHRLVYHLTPSQFRADTMAAVRAIEDTCGVSPKVYRAPSFSVTQECLWALEVLAECGFTHDSSICPLVHDRYGIPGFSRFPQLISTPSGDIMEVPVATVKLFSSHLLPGGGGGYLRLLPYRYSAAAIRRINGADRQPACLYVHSWELDVDQPRVASGFVSRIRTYTGLGGMNSKIRKLLANFSFSTLTAVCTASDAGARPLPLREISAIR